MAVMETVVDGPVVVRERLGVFAREVLGEAVNRQVQLVNGERYLRGLLEEGPRKSGGTPWDRSGCCESFDDPVEWVEGAIACRDAGIRRSRLSGS